MQNNGYVQANSVQSQFAALTRDRDKFQVDQEAAQRESTRAQERLQRLKQEQVSLMTKIQTAHESLGNLSRKHTMLKQEKARLNRVKESERKALEDCAAHTMNLARQDEEMTRKYVLELGMLNEEVASDLEKQIIEKVLEYVSVEAVENVFQENFPASANKQVFDEKFRRMKNLQETLEVQCQRHESAKADFDSVEAVRSQQQQKTPVGNADNSARHLDIFYGHREATQEAN